MPKMPFLCMIGSYSQDYPVWKPLMKILSTPSTNMSVDFLVVASSTLCNLLLEFSPSKEPILESGAIDLLCQLTHRYDAALVLNGVWGLMVSFEYANSFLYARCQTTIFSTCRTWRSEPIKE